VCAAHGLSIVTPLEPDRRGSQVSIAHPVSGYPMMQALIARGVIGDFRAPDVLRFGITPLYSRHVDVFDAVEQLRFVLDRELWRDAAYQTRAAVT
jgi:kynureninase